MVYKFVEYCAKKSRHFQIQRLPDGCCKVRWVRMFGLIGSVVHHEASGHRCSEFPSYRDAHDFIQNGWADRSVEKGWHS